MLVVEIVDGEALGCLEVAAGIAAEIAAEIVACLLSTAAADLGGTAVAVDIEGFAVAHTA